MMVEVTQEDRDTLDAATAEWRMGDSSVSLEIIAAYRQASYQRGKLEGARLALEAAANGLEAYAEAYTEQKNRAKDDKDRKAARDFESMALACAFRSAELRALDPAKIVGEG